MKRFWVMIDDEAPSAQLWFRISIAILAGVSAVVAAQLARQLLSVDLPFLFCIAAALAMASYAGLAATLIASVVAFSGTVALARPADPLVTTRHVVVVSIFCFCIAVIGEALRQSRGRERRLAVIARRRERVLEVLFKEAPAVIMIADEHNKVLAANLAATRLFAHDQSGLAGQSVHDLVGTTTLAEPVETTIRVDGRPRHLRTSATSLVMAGRRFHMVYVRDETEAFNAHEELARTQRELHQISRATALGQLGSSIAHELNQPLSFVTNYAGVAQAMLAVDQPDLPRIRQILDDMVAQVLRAADVLKRLRAFSGRRRFAPAEVDAADAIGEAIKFGQLAVKDARATLEVDSRVAGQHLFVDAVQLQQVILNLMINAADAVRLRSDRRIAVRAWVDTKTVQITVSDTGPGLPDTMQHKAFAPFQSTKENGVGIGLAICRTIVEAHGGRISCDSDPILGGARFLVSLPLASGGKQRVAS
jgi:two-component system sensor kinase FixL